MTAGVPSTDDRPRRPPALVVVAGPPGTGKTRFSRRVADQLDLPCFGKDAFKESLFDTLGVEDLERSWSYGVASFEALKIVTTECLRCSISLVIEGNFSDEGFAPFLRRLKDERPCEIFQVQLVCDGAILKERFLRRARSPERHPGHRGERYFSAVEPVLAEGRSRPLDVEGPLFTFDTSAFERLDDTPLVHALRDYLSAAGPPLPERSEP
ncbi:MAG: hypothetical protein AAGE94_13725 [Acidobacteriota bacterium]